MPTYIIHVGQDLDKAKAKSILLAIKLGKMKGKYDRGHRWFIVKAKEPRDRSELLYPFAAENVFDARVEEMK
ncbi:MAG: hypothetical protein IJU64_06495 [Bacilli bacterium]|nr:hypothetical protein [Bacilli bacterium]